MSPEGTTLKSDLGPREFKIVVEKPPDYHQVRGNRSVRNWRYENSLSKLAVAKFEVRKCGYLKGFSSQ